MSNHVSVKYFERYDIRNVGNTDLYRSYLRYERQSALQSPYP